MDWGLFVAVIALYVAIVEHRRNNSTSVAILKASGAAHTEVDVNNEKLFLCLEFTIRNRGLPLFSPTVALFWQSADGRGTKKFTLESADKAKATEFARGMIGTFSISTAGLREDPTSFLLDLSDIVKQNARLKIYSQGFEAYEISIGGWVCRLVHKWNRIANGFNYRFMRHVDIPTGKAVSIPKYLRPFSVDLFGAVESFLEMMRSERERNRERSEH